MMIGINAYYQKTDYEVFATVEQSVANIAFTHQGDLVYSHHPFFNPTLPENTATMIDGNPLAVNGKNLLVGCDGITADKNFEWVYYAPLNGTKLYRVKTTDLLNENLSETELDKRIETYSEKPNNGGKPVCVSLPYSFPQHFF